MKTCTGEPRRTIAIRTLLVAVLAVFSGAHFGVALAAETLQLDPRCKLLPSDLLGPFVRIDDATVLAIETTATRVSRDAGRTWSEPRPLFDAAHDIKVSNERAMLRTRDGVVIAAFMNLNERRWTWKNELHDAPGAQLPTCVMRSLDNGQTWQDIQKLHDDWSGYSDDDGKTWTPPVVIARQPKTWLAYPYLFEFQPGLLWLTTMQGGLRLELREQDFVP